MDGEGGKIGEEDESDSGEVRIGKEDAQSVCCVLSWDHSG